jgi:hypothetical protein
LIDGESHGAIGINFRAQLELMAISRLLDVFFVIDPASDVLLVDAYAKFIPLFVFEVEVLSCVVVGCIVAIDARESDESPSPTSSNVSAKTIPDGEG